MTKYSKYIQYTKIKKWFFINPRIYELKSCINNEDTISFLESNDIGILEYHKFDYEHATGYVAADVVAFDKEFLIVADTLKELREQEINYLLCDLKQQYRRYGNTIDSIVDELIDRTPGKKSKRKIKKKSK